MKMFRFEELQFDGTFYVKDIERYPTIDTGTIGEIVLDTPSSQWMPEVTKHLLTFFLSWIIRDPRYHKTSAYTSAAQFNPIPGIIFGYQELYKKQDQSQKIVRFYLATWRHDYHTFNNCAEGKWDNCYYGATTGN